MATLDVPRAISPTPRREAPLVVAKTMVLETNYACNLRCLHCYVPDGPKREAAFLDRDLAESLFDQFADNGFRCVLFTGGEPLLHPQFEALYESAWDRGFHVSLFTNGLLLDDERLELLGRKPPAVVRVSLFGGTPQSYREVAGRDGFALAYRRVLALRERGVAVRVKIPVLRQNAATAAALHRDLRRRGVPCKMDVRIIPRFDGDADVLRWRLSPEEILALELEDRTVNVRRFCELKQRPPSPVRTLRYCLERCQPFVINPEGWLQLCFFLRDRRVDLRRFSLREAITSLAAAMLDEGPAAASAVCLACDRQGFCSYCPGWARNEVGRAGEPIPFLCRLSLLYEDKYRQLERETYGRAAPDPEAS